MVSGLNWRIYYPRCWPLPRSRDIQRNASIHSRLATCGPPLGWFTSPTSGSTTPSSATGLNPIRPAGWRNSSNNVVLDENRGIIYFDADKGSAAGPPLRAFGEAIAARLLEDRRIGPAWSNALTEYEAGGLQSLDELLRKSGALSLCESYRRELQPLSAEAHEDIVSRIQAALAHIGTGLREPELYSLTTRVLSRADLLVPNDGWREITEDAIQQCLDNAGWSDEDRHFKPEFQCRDNNRQAWEKWLDTGSRRLRLLILVEALESMAEITSRREAEALLSTSKGQRLAASSSNHFSRVAFDPESTARGWLSATVTDLEVKLGDRVNLPLDQLLPPITRYQRVSSICTAGSANWSRSTFAAPKPVETALVPLSPEDRTAENAAKAEMGGDAEVALRELIVEQTANILDEDPTTWNLLSQALPAKGVARRKFDEARNNTGPLADALHVSATWGSAGYDLIGLERNLESRAVEVVRYEVKALPEAGTRIRLFISPNELAVYRRVVRTSNEDANNPRYQGQWRLIGVEPKGAPWTLPSFYCLCWTKPKAHSRRLDVMALRRMGSCYQSFGTNQAMRTEDVSGGLWLARFGGVAGGFCEGWMAGKGLRWRLTWRVGSRHRNRRLNRNASLRS